MARLRTLVVVLSAVLTAIAIGETAVEKRATGFEVTKPALGQTVTLSEDVDVSVLIEWTVPEDLADRPVLIRLMQGTNVSTLEQVDTVNASAPNNGSYTWYQDSDNVLYYSVSSYSNSADGAASGCNYTFSLKVWQDEWYSPYFTIIKPFDGGLPAAAACPQDQGIARPPGGSSYPTTRATVATSAFSTATATGSRPPAEGSDPGRSEGVSTATLAIAVAIPIAVLAFGFVFFIWLAFRKGWLSAGRRRASYVPGDMSVGDSTREAKGVTAGGAPFVSSSELHGRPRPYEGAGTPVYQLYGDETRRDAHSAH